MLGLILDFYWVSSTQDPVQVTELGTLQQLEALSVVNPQNVAAAWSRATVVPIKPHPVKSTYGGGTLQAHICAQKGSAFFEELIEDAGDSEA
jgi:hypothetical protein